MYVSDITNKAEGGLVVESGHLAVTRGCCVWLRTYYTGYNDNQHVGTHAANAEKLTSNWTITVC